jgi:hypothetical protein
MASTIKRYKPKTRKTVRAYSRSHSRVKRGSGMFGFNTFNRGIDPKTQEILQIKVNALNDFKKTVEKVITELKRDIRSQLMMVFTESTGLRIGGSGLTPLSTLSITGTQQLPSTRVLSTKMKPGPPTTGVVNKVVANPLNTLTTKNTDFSKIASKVSRAAPTLTKEVNTLVRTAVNTPTITASSIPPPPPALVRPPPPVPKLAKSTGSIDVNINSMKPFAAANTIRKLINLASDSTKNIKSILDSIVTNEIKFIYSLSPNNAKIEALNICYNIMTGKNNTPVSEPDVKKVKEIITELLKQIPLVIAGENIEKLSVNGKSPIQVIKADLLSGNFSQMFNDLLYYLYNIKAVDKLVASIVSLKIRSNPEYIAKCTEYYKTYNTPVVATPSRTQPSTTPKK